MSRAYRVICNEKLGVKTSIFIFFFCSAYTLKSTVQMNIARNLNYPQIKCLIRLELMPEKQDYFPIKN